MESRFEKRTLYIQENAGFYLNKFGIMEATGSKASWNWCAFLFTSAWMIYRKMYKMGIIVMIIEFLILPFLSYRMAFIPVPLTMSAAPFIQGIDLLLSFGVNIILGVLGNFLYMKHIDSLIDSEPSADPGTVLAYQQKYGGHSWNLVGIYLIIAIVVNSITESMF